MVKYFNRSVKIKIVKISRGFIKNKELFNQI